MDVTITRSKISFRRPFEAAFGELTERTLFTLRIIDHDGTVALGEAAPLPAYDGSSLAEVETALNEYAEVLRAAGSDGRTQLLDRCWQLEHVPQAFAAVDIALWDLEGKRAGRSVAELLNDRAAEEVPINQTITGSSPDEVARQAAAAHAAGFCCIKLKVGLGDDYDRVAAARTAAGPEMAIRIDANGTWSVNEAIEQLEELADLDIEYCEEPTHGVLECFEVRERSKVKIALDESATDHEAITAGGADAICLKVSRLAGITGAWQAAQRARFVSADVYVSSTFDGPIGTAAGLQLAAALAPTPCCGLGTLDALEVDSPFTVSDGKIRLPTGPGLGI